MSASGTSGASGSSVPGTTGTPARFAAVRAAVLLPIVSIASGVGPDEGQPGVAHRRGEVFVLGEEAVAGMHARRRPIASPRRSARRCAGSSRAARSVRSRTPRRRSARAAPSDRTRSRRRPATAHLAARADDPHGDLAAVGDEDLFQQSTVSTRGTRERLHAGSRRVYRSGRRRALGGRRWWVRLLVGVGELEQRRFAPGPAEAAAARPAACRRAYSPSAR